MTGKVDIQTLVIVLNADKTINYDQVIAILDALKGVGIKNIALGTELK